MRIYCGREGFLTLTQIIERTVTATPKRIPAWGMSFTQERFTRAQLALRAEPVRLPLRTDPSYT